MAIRLMAIGYATGAFVNRARAGLAPDGLQSPIAALRAIAAYGKANPGHGRTCAAMAEIAINNGERK